MRITHRTSRILLWPPCRPADHLSDEILEAGPGDAMMRFIDFRIGVQQRVVHDAVNKVINDGGNGIDAPEPVIEGFLSWCFLAGSLMCHVSYSFHCTETDSRPLPTRRRSRRLPVPALLCLPPYRCAPNAG